MKTHYDVIVLGGGIAGVAAALASARNGADTCLIEKEYCLGGLATLGLIVVYLPLDDGQGEMMSGGLAEELLKLSAKEEPELIPELWRNDHRAEERKGRRYQVTYNAADMMIRMEKLLTENGVALFYDLRLAGARARNGRITAVTVDSKRGPVEMTADAFVDATGDADLAFFAGEPVAEYDRNSRTGWYFSMDGEKRVKLHKLTDDFYHVTDDMPHYNGLDPEDISRHMQDMHSFIAQHAAKQDPPVKPFMIPAFHGLRTTRRLDTARPFDANRDEGTWCEDCIGMIGNWREPRGRYALPYSILHGVENDNLFMAGRCVSAIGDGWDLARVIPSGAVTGQAAGTAAAMTAKGQASPEIAALQKKLAEQGVLLRPELFDRKEQA